MIPTYMGYREQSSSFIHVVVYINIPSILRLSDIPLYAYILVCFVCINVSIYINVSISRGFPGDSAVKNPPANAGDLGSIPWRRKCQHTPVFLPGKSQEERRLVGYRLVAKESDTTQQLNNICQWTLGVLPPFQFFWMNTRSRIAGAYTNSIQILRNHPIVSHSLLILLAV